SPRVFRRLRHLLPVLAHGAGQVLRDLVVLRIVRELDVMRIDELPDDRLVRRPIDVGRVLLPVVLEHVTDSALAGTFAALVDAYLLDGYQAPPDIADHASAAARRSRRAAARVR